MLDYDLDTGAYDYRVAARNAAGLSPFAYVQTGPSSLAIFLATTNTAVVSWPRPSTGWNLQQNNDGTNNFIIVNPPTGKRFYRLFKP